MALVEHEVPEHDLIHLLELRKENLEIVEVRSPRPAFGGQARRLEMPEGARLISVMREGPPRSRSASTSSRRATRCSPSSSPARRTSCAACSSASSFHRSTRHPSIYPVTVRRIHSPLVVALVAALVGLMGLVTSLTPAVATHSRLVTGTLPEGWPAAARTIALALGLGMIFFSRGLARRGKRRAWYLAVAIVIASALAHLAKGLDFEEATDSPPAPADCALPGAPPVRCAG